jgi:hypothetical protein
VCRPLLDERPYSQLCDEEGAEVVDGPGAPEPSDAFIDNMNLDIGPVRMLTDASKELIRPFLKEYATYVGPELAARMILKFT